jgi:UDP-N-acetylmuramyl pentapeptide phosphotransferase/UDP-N-acetylglucosamine-1-phosphate transferase
MKKIFQDRIFLILFSILASILSYFYWNLAQENASQILILLVVVFLFDDNRKLKAEIKQIKESHKNDLL